MDQNQFLIYKDRLRLARLLLRIGLAVVFSYAALEAFTNPAAFLKYIPDFIVGFINTDIFLPIFGAAEVFLTIWLLTGYRIRYAAIMAFFLMAAIVGFNPEYFNILFRNIAIGFAALALALLEEADAVVIN
jgi:uncharacterized membrane protein YphA (DoxX/SURF4 family)